MTEGDDTSHRFLPRIRQELDKLPLTDAQKDAVIPDLLKQAAFLDTNGGTRVPRNLKRDSAFFDFARKCQTLVSFFENDGLILRDTLQAAVECPQLFDQAPETLAANIAGVVDRFAADGITTRSYLQAALKQPSLFCTSPQFVADCIDGVVQRFTDERLTRGDYLHAALKQPSLFCSSPETVAANINGVVQRFADDGLTRREYLQAALKTGQVFCQSPQTITANITGVADHFAADGLTCSIYLKAVLKKPTLFVQAPETIARHINAVLDFTDSGIFNPPSPRRSYNLRPAPDRNPAHAAAIDFVLNNPYLMTLADDNFGLREVHHRLTHGPTNSRLLKYPRHAVERELMQNLGHDDPKQSVPTDGFIAGAAQPTEEQAKRFLLRALIHAGFIRGGNMER